MEGATTSRLKLAVVWCVGLLVAGAAVGTLRAEVWFPSHLYTIAAAAAVLALWLISAPFLLRRLGRTRFNVQMARIASVFLTFVFLCRVLGWRLGLTIFDAMRVECLSLAMVWVVVSLAVDDRLWWPTMLACALAVGAIAWPPLAFEFAIFGQTATLLWAGSVWVTRGAPVAD